MTLNQGFKTQTLEELFGKGNWPAVQQHAIHNPLLASALKIIEQLAADVASQREIGFKRNQSYWEEGVAVKITRYETVIELARVANDAYCHKWTTMYAEMENLRAALAALDAQ